MVYSFYTTFHCIFGFKSEQQIRYKNELKSPVNDNYRL